jgi:hypothetical protein
MLKVDNIKKANINKSMKMKIHTLEDKVRRLLLSQHKSLFHRIKELLGDVDYYESDDLSLSQKNLRLQFRLHFIINDL